MTSNFRTSALACLPSACRSDGDERRQRRACPAQLLRGVELVSHDPGPGAVAFALLVLGAKKRRRAQRDAERVLLRSRRLAAGKLKSALKGFRRKPDAADLADQLRPVRRGGRAHPGGVGFVFRGAQVAQRGPVLRGGGKRDALGQDARPLAVGAGGAGFGAVEAERRLPFRREAQIDNLPVDRRAFAVGGGGLNRAAVRIEREDAHSGAQLRFGRIDAAADALGVGFVVDALRVRERRQTRRPAQLRRQILLEDARLAALEIAVVYLAEAQTERFAGTEATGEREVLRRFGEADLLAVAVEILAGAQEAGIDPIFGVADVVAELQSGFSQRGRVGGLSTHAVRGEEYLTRKSAAEDVAFVGESPQHFRGAVGRAGDGQNLELSDGRGERRGRRRVRVALGDSRVVAVGNPRELRSLERLREGDLPLERVDGVLHSQQRASVDDDFDAVSLPGLNFLPP